MNKEKISKKLIKNMTMSGWTSNCKLMINKMTDSDSNPNNNILIDAEGYGEDY